MARCGKQPLCYDFDRVVDCLNTGEFQSQFGVSGTKWSFGNSGSSIFGFGANRNPTTGAGTDSWTSREAVQERVGPTSQNGQSGDSNPIIPCCSGSSRDDRGSPVGSGAGSFGFAACTGKLDIVALVHHRLQKRN